ncbi:uncharacterized protein CC84DRAFT_959165 [Paraphaeosphaeria sporulosa]|uniref:Uncharacterized protein n=1 Tax=Paraphaeosphaeria sporulosa TaxID=1460663 RepID=A0A177C5T1_9PLEO|nr:uncharacterized protein CC84DRAFT_959165 [Paraphaeosphaeria sporulosa]OAG03114.1 hypothetical protein CC84DRAFT_959165 [Paraphaeosphaeria sporulosa]
MSAPSSRRELWDSLHNFLVVLALFSSCRYMRKHQSRALDFTNRSVVVVTMHATIQHHSASSPASTVPAQHLLALVIPSLLPRPLPCDEWHINALTLHLLHSGVFTLVQKPADPICSVLKTSLRLLRGHHPALRVGDVHHPAACTYYRA